MWQPGMTLDDVKVITLSQVLFYFNGDKSKTARALRVSERFVRYWVKKEERLIAYRREAPKRMKRPEGPESYDYE